MGEVGGGELGIAEEEEEGEEAVGRGELWDVSGEIGLDVGVEGVGLVCVSVGEVGVGK